MGLENFICFATLDAKGEGGKLLANGRMRAHAEPGARHYEVSGASIQYSLYNQGAKNTGKSRLFEQTALLKKTDADNMTASVLRSGHEKTGKNGG